MQHLFKFISVFLLCGLFTCGTGTGTGEKTAREPVLTDFQDLFNAALTPGVECYRIPSLVTAVNGDVIAAIDERVPDCADLRGSKDINIVLRRSEDNGVTWSEKITVVDFPYGQSASDPSMIVDRMSGDVLLFYNYMDLDIEPDVYYLHVVRSKDDGKTWGEPEDITDQISKPEWHNDFKFITSGRAFQTRDGKILHTLVNLNSGLHIFSSDDHGDSWYLIDTPIEHGDESKIIELDNGDWMVNSRINRAGYRYVHISSDEGKTWRSEPAHELVDPGNNGSIIRYSSVSNGDDKNRLIFSNCNSPDSRTNLTIRISYDEGKTWSEGKTLYAGEAAYSDLTVLENGDIGIFFEKDDYTENAFASFNLEWLTDREDGV